MTEHDVMSDEDVLKIIFEKKRIDNQTLDNLLYRLCHAGDNQDSLQYYTHITFDVYCSKICNIFNHICRQVHYPVEVLECKYITNKDIKDRVDALPTFPLIEFIEASEFNFFVVVDYEAPDEVYKCDYLLDILEDTCMKRIINDELEQDSINNIINYINDLDLFDIVLYEEYNNKKLELVK